MTSRVQLLLNADRHYRNIKRVVHDATPTGVKKRPWWGDARTMYYQWLGWVWHDCERIDVYAWGSSYKYEPTSELWENDTG